MDLLQPGGLEHGEELGQVSVSVHEALQLGVVVPVKIEEHILEVEGGN